MTTANKDARQRQPTKFILKRRLTGTTNGRIQSGVKSVNSRKARSPDKDMVDVRDLEREAAAKTKISLERNAKVFMRSIDFTQKLERMDNG